MTSSRSASLWPYRDFLLVALLYILHTWFVWGYTGLWWGDHGRWLHEVERFAGGEIPYRDFEWHFPPLAIWIFGLWARVFGSDLTPIAVLTSALGGVTSVLYVAYARRILGRIDVPLTVGAFVLALTYAGHDGSPLPMGLYTPAALVGGLLIVALAFLVLGSRDDRMPASSALIGALIGLGILSKQDFWIPAAYLGVLWIARGRARRARRAAAVIPVALLIVALGATLVGTSAGWSRVAGIPSGFAHLALSRGRALPTWERVTAELIVVSFVIAAVATAAGLIARNRRVTMAGVIAAGGTLAAITLYVAMSIRFARFGIEGALDTPLAVHAAAHDPMLRPVLGSLIDRIDVDLLPALLPACVVVLLLARRHLVGDSGQLRRLVWLLAFAVTLRLRRGFEHTEWFELLLTVPILMVALEALCGWMPEGGAYRLRSAFAMVLLLLALVQYRRLGFGPLTKRRLTSTTTLRGSAHWPAQAAAEYRLLLATLDSADPARSRGLLGFGYTGGLNYFLRRSNPTPFTQDFYFSAIPADSVLPSLQEKRASLFLVDRVYITRFYPDGIVHWDRWGQSSVPSVYVTYDRPRFDHLAHGCSDVPLTGRTIFRVLDCAATAR